MSYVLNQTSRSRRRCCGRSAEDASNFYFAPRTLARLGTMEQGYLGRRRNVFYEGPCPEAPQLEGCNPPHRPPRPPHPDDPDCYPPRPCPIAYGYFAQVGSLTAVAGAALPISSVVQESGSFEISDNIVTICRPGTYLATFALNLPACSSVSTNIVLTLDGVPIPGSSIIVEHTPGAPSSVFTQVIFTTCRPCMELEVIPSRGFTLVADEPCQTLSSLTLVEIG